MSADPDFLDLLSWCREAPLDAGCALVEDGYWGLYATNSALDLAWFWWFPTRHNLLKYLADCWPANVHDDPTRLEADTGLMLRAARFGELARLYAEGDLPEPTFLSRLSEAHPHVRVHWLGTLADLLYGDGDPEDGEDPIAERELDDAYRALAIAD